MGRYCFNCDSKTPRYSPRSRECYCGDRYYSQYIEEIAIYTPVEAYTKDGTRIENTFIKSQEYFKCPTCDIIIKY